MFAACLSPMGWRGVKGGKGAKGVGLPSVGGCGKQPSSYKTLDSESQSNNPGSKKM